MEPLPPPFDRPPRRPSRGVGERFAIGLALGCGGLVVIALVIAGLGVYWALSTGEQVPTPRVIGRESVGFFHLGDLAENPNVLALLDTVLEQTQAQDRRQLPESLRWLEALQQDPSAEDVAPLLPREVTVALEEPVGGEPEYLVAANFKVLTRVAELYLDLTAEGGSLRRVHYQDGQLYELGDGFVISFDGGTLLLGRSVDGVKRGIDRLQAESSEAGVPFEEPEEEWDLFGRVRVERWMVRALVPELDPGSPHLPQHGSFSLNVASPDRLEGGSVFQFESPGRALLGVGFLNAGLEDWARRLAPRGHELAYETTAQNETAIVAFEISGLKQALERVLRELQSGSAP